MENINFYAVIPAPVLNDAGLSSGAKLLYGTIAQLLNEEGFCFASNAYLARRGNTSPRTIRRWLEELQDGGHITVIIERNAAKDQEPQRRIFSRYTGPDKNGQPGPDKNGQPGPDKNGHHKIKDIKNKSIKKGTTVRHFSDKPKNDGVHFDFNPDLTKNNNALDQLNNWIENYNDRMQYTGEDRRCLPLQGMADFLEVLKSGFRNGKYVKTPAALLESWLNATFEDGNGWSQNRAEDERLKLSNGQTVIFHCFGADWERNTPLRRLK